MLKLLLSSVHKFAKIDTYHVYDLVGPRIQCYDKRDLFLLYRD